MAACTMNAVSDSELHVCAQLQLITTIADGGCQKSLYIWFQQGTHRMHIALRLHRRGHLSPNYFPSLGNAILFYNF